MNGADCSPIRWKRASVCGTGAICVEVAKDGDEVLVRDSAKPHIVIRTSEDGWRAFVAGAKNGEFDF